MNEIDVKGRTAVITGASQGLGAGLAMDFLDRGLQLGLCARREPAVAPSESVLSQRVDVRDEAAITAFAKQVEERFETVDLWINNAGVLDPIGPMRDLEVAAFREHIDTNLLGVFLGTRCYVRHLRKTGRPGVLINVSSGAAWKAYEGWSPYCASKAAVERFTECVQLEEEGTGLRAYSVAPGVVDTQMQDKIRACSPDLFPEVDRFRELKEEDAFNSVEFVSRELIKLAFDPEYVATPVAQRLPDEKG